MNSNKTITATFTILPPVYYTLTINKVGNGTVTPASGNSYLVGTVVNIEAKPDTGWQFKNWSGDLSSTTNKTTITMTSNKTIIATFTINPTVLVVWTAYNDLAGAAAASPTTNYHSGNSGPLKDYATGTVLGVNVSISGGTNNGTGPGVLPSGTDAYNIFYGKINLDGYILHYTNGPHVFTFTGLDPSKRYRFVQWADRADVDYNNTYYSAVIISDVTSFSTNSSAGVTISTNTMPNDNATYCTGYNSLRGQVAGFTDIDPGSDGDMTITVTAGPYGSGGAKYYSGAFMLQEFLPTQMNFTIIALPDTQEYMDWNPLPFTAQMNWIANNREALNIVFVTGEGDITSLSTIQEWDRASAGYALIEDPVTTGLLDGIPYTIPSGKHDWYYDPTGALTYYNQYFNVSRFTGRSYYGGNYPTGKNDNHYALFNASGMDFIAVAIQGENPPTDAINWADTILSSHSNRRAIVITHALINTDATWMENGQTIYNTLKDNPNLFLMLCGHEFEENRRAETYNGNTVNILLANYQTWDPRINGHEFGYLRIMTFHPSLNQIEVKTYSPYANTYETGPSSQFTLTYVMN
jgi:hypothetical protein